MPSSPAHVPRPDAKVPFVPPLEALRGFAALFVCLFHTYRAAEGPDGTPPPLGADGELGEQLGFLNPFALVGDEFRDVLSTGRIGVNLFFVLSGFVLLLPAASRGTMGSIRDYAVRRVARIAPAHWVVLAACFVLMVLFERQRFDQTVTPELLLSQLTVLQGDLRLIEAFDGPLGFGWNSVTWSLTTEIVFYAVLPLIAVPFVKRPVAWAIGLVALEVFLRWALINPLEEPVDSRARAVLLSTFWLSMGNFALGMLACCLFVRWREHPRAKQLAPWIALAGAALFLWVCGSIGGPDNGAIRSHIRKDLGWSVLIPFSAAVLVLGLALWGKPRGRIAAKLGLASYGIYLVHIPVLKLARLEIEPDGSNLTFLKLAAIAVPGSIALGLVLAYTVEQPARRAARRWIARRRAGAAPEELMADVAGTPAVQGVEEALREAGRDDLAEQAAERRSTETVADR